MSRAPHPAVGLDGRCVSVGCGMGWARRVGGAAAVVFRVPVMGRCGGVGGAPRCCPWPDPPQTSCLCHSRARRGGIAWTPGAPRPVSHHVPHKSPPPHRSPPQQESPPAPDLGVFSWAMNTSGLSLTPESSIQGASLDGEGLPSAPPPQRAPPPLGGPPSPAPKVGGTPCVCLCFALHTHSPGHVLTQPCTPECAFALPPTAVHTHTALHTSAHTCACSCTTLHTPAMLPQPRTPVYTLTHLCMLSQTCAHSHRPVHALAHPCNTLMCPAHLCTLSHSTAHLCAHLHTCAHSCTSLRALPQPCTLFHSHNALPALHTCAFPPLCTLSPRCALWPSPAAVAHTLHAAPSLCSLTSLVPLPSPGRPCTLHTFLHTHPDPSPVPTAHGGTP